MRVSLIVDQINKKSVIVQSKEMATQYYIKLSPIRKEMKTFLVFSKKVENVTIDLGFDIGFRTPNSDMKKLAEKYVKNEQLRARATELFVYLNKIKYKLDYLFEHSKDHILVEYGALMSSMTKEAKTSLINIVFEDLLRHKNEVEEVMSSLNKILSSMDGAYWTLREVTSIGDGIISRSKC
jgi:hypothetical protein